MVVAFFLSATRMAPGRGVRPCADRTVSHSFRSAKLAEGLGTKRAWRSTSSGSSCRSAKPLSAMSAVRRIRRIRRARSDGRGKASASCSRAAGLARHSIVPVHPGRSMPAQHARRDPDCRLSHDRRRGRDSRRGHPQGSWCVRGGNARRPSRVHPCDTKNSGHCPTRNTSARSIHADMTHKIAHRGRAAMVPGLVLEIGTSSSDAPEVFTSLWSWARP